MFNGIKEAVRGWIDQSETGLNNLLSPRALFVVFGAGGRAYTRQLMQGIHIQQDNFFTLSFNQFVLLKTRKHTANGFYR